MIFRGAFTFGKCPLHDDVDYTAIFRMQADHSAVFGGLLHGAKNRGVVHHQHAGIGHEELKTRDALTRPTTAEGEATGRAIALAEMAGAPVYIVHLSCNDALEKVREARDRGLPAYAETCPQYLFLSIEKMDAPGFESAKYVFTPPLREKWHQEKLWQGLTRDTLQVVSTDHCPFCFKEQKELGKDDFSKIPNGGPGIEHRLSLVYTGGVHGGWFSPNRFVQLVSTAPAKLFGLFPRKGTIAVGSDADIVIFDANEEQTISAQTHHMRIDYSMYEGIRVKGVPKTVLSRGRVIVDNGKFVGRAGSGEFVRRQAITRLAR